MHSFTRILGAFAFAATGVGAVSLIAACQNTGDSGSSTGSDGGTGLPTTTFAPAGCNFKVAPRAEYTDWSSGKTDVGTTPNIRRVRLGLGGNVAPGSAGHANPATTIGVAWQTDEGTTASEIQWGTGMDPTTWPKANVATGVTWDTPPGSLVGNGPERMHEVYICGLTPATTYSYRVGGGPSGKEVWSDVYQFTTTPSDPSATVTFAVTGDARGNNGDAWQILEGRLLGLPTRPALQLFSGDMIDVTTNQLEWEDWVDKAWKDSNNKLSALGQLLTLAAHGNHDNHSSLFYGNLTLPQDLTAFPQYTELFFSVDVGPAHIVVIDDTFIAEPTLDSNFLPVFKPWLEADLTAAQANRAKVPWIIAVHHRPEYSSSTHGKDPDVLTGRTWFGPEWDKYHVDLVLAGHDHDYERTKPLTGPTDSPTLHTENKDGTVYVVCAGSGADAYSSATSTFSALSRDFTNGTALGLYSVLTVTPASLKIEAHELLADASDPIFDTVTLTK